MGILTRLRLDKYETGLEQTRLIWRQSAPNRYDRYNYLIDYEKLEYSVIGNNLNGRDND